MSLHHPIENLILSRSTIRRSRMAVRKDISTLDMETFHPASPSVLLHWDEKLLPHIFQSTETMDRIAVIASGGGVEKLLAILKISSGSGKDQADVCLNIFSD